jgi:predicted SAM-dependent methyltransferase
MKVNLACGCTFVDGQGWINLDFEPGNPAVQQADLLGYLPIDDCRVSILYSSHFLEHIPKSQVKAFLLECYRVLKPGGVIRLVLPDFEEMCREYILRRDNNEHIKADFLVVEIIDQCVRLRGGGELKDVYQRIANTPDSNQEMIEFVRLRNGETLGMGRCHKEENAMGAGIAHQSLIARLILKISNRTKSVKRQLSEAWFSWLIGRLPSAFRRQNISFAPIGERHHWLWDLHQISDVLLECGYTAIARCQCNTSRIAGFPFFPLDVDEEGRPRKGAESMYIEAIKPY